MPTPSVPARRGARVWIALCAVSIAALPACQKHSDRAASHKPPAPTTAPTRALAGPALAPLVRRLPADVSWAVILGRVDRTAALLQGIHRLLLDHPRFRTQAADLQKRWTNRWGRWLLSAEARRAVGIPDAASLVIAQRPAGAHQPPITLLILRGLKPDAVARALTAALRRRGARAVTPLQRVQQGARSLIRFDGRWTCDLGATVTRCADVPPARWAAAVTGPGGTLRQHGLGSLSDAELRGTGAVYLGRRVLQRLWPHGDTLDALLGTRPEQAFVALELDRQIRIRARLLSSKRSPMPARRPAPSATGLAAGAQASVVLRLQLDPAELVKRLLAWAPKAPFLKALLSPTPHGTPAPFLDGSVLLISTAEGIGLRFGLQDPARAARALARLELDLASRLPAWQRRVRRHGAGWDLTLTRKGEGDAAVAQLRLHLPQGTGNPYPSLRGSELTLRWTRSGQHLLVASDPRLFRQLRAAVDRPDRTFLDAEDDPGIRAAFQGPARLALRLRPDDPLTTLPAAQARSLARWVADQRPATRRAWSLARAASDLIHELAVVVRPRRDGALVEASIRLVHPPGSGRELSPDYRAALRKKWGGNLSGFQKDLRSFAAGDPSPARAKARRNLPYPGAASHSGGLGLFASIYAPWSLRRHRAQIHRSGRAGLLHLASRLAALAETERSRTDLPEVQRRRWVRRLRSTPLTPVRRCCASPTRHCVSRPADWSHPTWRALGFHLDGPHRYRYQVRLRPEPTTTRVELLAVGDPDCDGVSTQLLLVARVDRATGDLHLGPIRRIHREHREHRGADKK